MRLALVRLLLSLYAAICLAIWLGWFRGSPWLSGLLLVIPWAILAVIFWRS